jgi:cytochrome c oxidase subunit II
MTARRPQRAPVAGSGLRLAARVLVIAGLALLVAGCGITLGGDTGELPQNALDPAGPVARSQHELWTMVFPIAVGVFVLVQGAVLWTAIRYRVRGTETSPPKQIAGNTRLEVLWTIIPAVILAVVAVPTVQKIFEIAADPGEQALQVRVVGKQYWWEFEYLGDEGQGVVTANELVIPTDRPVYLHMEARSAVIPDAGPGENRNNASADGVVHSFWVPRLAGKQDVVPGHTRRMTIEAEEPGRYPGQCAEFCGLSHARMRFVVEAQEPADFDAWLSAQAQPSEPEPEGLVAEGQTAVDTAGCLACHAIDGHPADQGARVGPDLTHFASRETFAGAIFRVDDDEDLEAWLRNPPAVKAGAQMPPNLVSDDTVGPIIEYLRSLE